MANLMIQPSLATDQNVTALAELAERITYLDVDTVIAQDVRNVPASVLPHLADQFHIRHTVAWQHAKSTAEQRSLIRTSLLRHQLKGTLAGFRLAAKDAGAELIGAITPPAKLFAAPAQTVAERNEFVSRYPQLRLYRYRVVGQRQGGMLSGAILGRTFPLISDALLRVMPRAYLWVNGQETELSVVERETTTSTHVATTVTEIRAEGKGGSHSFCNHFPHHLAQSDAGKRIYSLQLTETYQDSSETVQRSVVQPGLSVLETQYDQVAMPGNATGLFAGQVLHGQTQVSTARDRLFQRLYLFSPDVALGRRIVGLHLNQGRLSMPPFHAELAVKIVGNIQPTAVWRFTHGHLVQQPQTNLNDCLESMRDVARAADRISLDTSINRPATAGEQNTASVLCAGAWTIN
jgi:hypothetical protein